MSDALDIPVLFEPSPSNRREGVRLLIHLTLHLDAPLGSGTALEAIERTSALLDQSLRGLQLLGINSRREPLCFADVRLPSDYAPRSGSLPPARAF
jgi:hypothetical protein